MTINDLKLQFASTEWPTFLELQKTEHGCAILLFIRGDIDWFQGHFPAQPVLAGVVQTHWAAEIGKFLFPLGDEFLGMDNIKFQTVILPNQQITLNLEYQPEHNALKFRYSHNELRYSEGKLAFQQQPTIASNVE
jgi:3-hydroxymyristoyl/3-hydroxydecanoyl-(acyl carrier protein) dehydratase